jgi:hypothetical protein
MPAARLWRRIVSHHEQERKNQEEEIRWRAFHEYTVSRAISFAFAINKELPPTKKQSKKKKPTEQDWRDIDDMHVQYNNLRRVYGKGHENVYEFCNFMGIPNHFDAPPEPEKKEPRTLGNFPNTKEGRAARKKAVQDMEARMIKALDRIVDAGEEGQKTTLPEGTRLEDISPPSGGSYDRRAAFAEERGIK